MHVDLIDAGDAVDHMQAEVVDLHAGFFEDFAGSAFFYGLAIFHVTARDIPVAQTRTDGALGEEDFAAPNGQAAGDDVGVLVVDGLAGNADEAVMGVSFDLPKGYGVGAVGAVFHDARVDRLFLW